MNSKEETSGQKTSFLWLGDQKFQDLCCDGQLSVERLAAGNNKLDANSSASTTSLRALGLVLLYGTWNGRKPTGYLHEKELLTNWIQQATQGHELDAASGFSLFAATVQVDIDDDLTCNRLIEGEDDVENSKEKNDSTQHKLPIPPVELPALAVVLREQTTEEWTHNSVKLLYVTENVRPHSLLDALNGVVSRPSSSVVTSPSASIQKAISDTVDSVLKDLDSRMDIDATTTDGSAEDDALRIFVAGDRSSVGKSSVCLGILGSLLKMGYSAKSLAYIKPATQSESTQLIQLFCEKHGIRCVPIGPLVYYRGFTRAFLAGETEPTTTLLQGCQEAVDRVAQGRRVVLVDGVGFPAVGSICGTDNAAVLRACSYPVSGSSAPIESAFDESRKPMGVVLVGGSGVGGAVDAFNLNACYFEQRGVPVLGAIFNKLSATGFYSLENCKSQISLYFDQHQQPRRGRPFGFLPLFPAIAGEKAMDHVDEYLNIFSSHVDVAAIIDAAKLVKESNDYNSTTNIAASAATGKSAATEQPTKRRNLTVATNASAPKKSREEIEGLAISRGAAPSA